MMKKIFTVLLSLAIFAGVQAQDKPYKAYMISNAHLDSQWDWDIQTTINEYLSNTLKQNFYLIENYPDYVFNFEGAVKYHWMKEYYPEDFERLRGYVKAGRWNVTGSSWDANDPNMPSSESFLRNLLLGQRFYMQEFGVKSNDIFLPDCFGFGYQIPTLAVHAGLKGFSTQKLQWRARPFYEGKYNKIPFRIGYWEGLDGSEVLAVLDAGNYNYSYYDEDLSHNPELISWAEDNNGIAYRYYGTGDFGGSPDIPSVHSLELGIKGDGPVQIISTSPSKFFDAMTPYSAKSWPRYQGELLMDIHATGCYSSQAMMKRMNRRNEQLADAAERAGVLADWAGAMEYPADEIRSEWKRFIWHHFHDDLTGTSLPQVYTYSWNDEILSQTRLAEIIRAESAYVSGLLDTSGEGLPIVVFNPTAYSRRDIVELSAGILDPAGQYVAVGPDGRKSPVQFTKDADGNDIAIFPASVEASGYSVFHVVKGKSSRSTTLKVSEKSLENSCYAIKLNSNGDIVSMKDKRNGRELVQAGKAFRLAMFDDNPSDLWPAWEIMPETLMKEPTEVSDNVKLSVVEKGPVRATIKVTRSHNGSDFTQYLSLYSGSNDDCLYVDTDIHWDTRNALVKAEFNTSVSTSEASYDIGIGNVRRGNNTLIQYEVYGHQWADVSNSKYGISILNDSKYGWDKPNDNTLRLTLVHAPSARRDRSYQQTQDHGDHHIRMAIFGHKGGTVKASGVNAEADCFNRPLMAFVAAPHSGTLGKTLSFVKSSTPQISVKAVKKAEEADGYVVRINEIWGEQAKNVKLSFPAEILEAYRMNGIEERSGDVAFSGKDLIFSTTAFHPETFFVKLKPLAEKKELKNIPVNLPYNKYAYTSDSFNRQGHFDSKMNSYALELIPAVIKDRGINFRMHNVEGEKNCVSCDGQTIKLPASEGVLYLLASSDDIDRIAEFTLGGKTVEAKVPYWTGFYGQWGRTGFSEGYVKDADVAYIGTHRHDKHSGNAAYVLSYMYRIAIPLNGSDTITLPRNKHINIFAATVSDASGEALEFTCEQRALPKTTKAVVYEK